MKAAGIVYTNGNLILLLKKPSGKWGIPGGKIEKGETPEEAAKRESLEECGFFIGKLFDKLSFENYITFFYKIDKPFKCKLSKEHNDYEWVKIDEVKDYNLHSKFERQWKRDLKIIKKNLFFKEWLNESQWVDQKRKCKYCKKPVFCYQSYSDGDFSWAKCVNKNCPSQKNKGLLEPEETIPVNFLYSLFK